MADDTIDGTTKGYEVWAGGKLRNGEPMHTITTKDRMALVTVTIDGEEYTIVDIGMRMLTPAELYRAQGFPEDYKINIRVGKKLLSKGGQVRMCGNSCSPHPVEALVAANQATIEQADVGST